jgi:hypothetical protein
MNKPVDAALKMLSEHPDEKVREASALLNADNIRRRKILTLIRDALAQLRLDMKYITFDLEATRRERDELRGKV